MGREKQKTKIIENAGVVRRAVDVASWDMESDVVIIGLGGAGACAALEARGAGAEVLVFERAWRGGGTSALASGQLYMGGGTPLQKDCGFEDSVEEMVKYMIASCGPGADEEKIRFYAERSVEHYHWLVELGIPFKASYMHYLEGTDPHTDDGLTYTGSELAYPYNEIARPAPRGHTVQQVGENAGGLMMDILLEAVLKQGAVVHVDAPCQTLIQDAEGRVVGAVVKIDDVERNVRARRGVILTAGGFINNREMVRRYAPLLRRCKFRIGSDGDDGSGIRMGIGAGGAAVRMGAGQVDLPFSPPRQLIKGILVNAQGQRFINEDVYQSVAGETALYRQNGEVYLIVDDEVYLPEQKAPATVLAVGNTAEELEREAGFPTGSLSHTLAVYNENAARGEDPLFHKAKDWLKPLDVTPLAVLDLRASHYIYAAFTLGGLHTRPTGEVLDVEGRAIPGLYAAGRTTSGLPAQGYNSGTSLADCTFFGRIAGLTAAAHEPAK